MSAFCALTTVPARGASPASRAPFPFASFQMRPAREPVPGKGVGVAVSCSNGAAATVKRTRGVNHSPAQTTKTTIFSVETRRRVFAFCGVKDGSG